MNLLGVATSVPVLDSLRLLQLVRRNLERHGAAGCAFHVRDREPARVSICDVSVGGDHALCRDVCEAECSARTIQTSRRK